MKALSYGRNILVDRKILFVPSKEAAPDTSKTGLSFTFKNESVSPENIPEPGPAKRPNSDLGNSLREGSPGLNP
jgi:hypothetical protein